MLNLLQIILILFTKVAAKLNEKIVKAKNIPTKILKEFKTELSEPLSNMINVSFNKGVFPVFLKVANVISIHKKRKTRP